MQYSSVTAARFLSRPNRFVALVEQGGRVLTVHVKNTGRCAELLQPGTTVYLTPGQNFWAIFSENALNCYSIVAL